MPPFDRAQAAIVGRDEELRVVDRWLAARRPACLELAGEAGIGKTTLWEAAAESASGQGGLVLASRPAEIETAVSYAGLASLLEPALAVVADDVPPPRLRALEGALRLRELEGSRLDETAVALGVLSLLRALVALRPTVVAIEDVQWLDQSSRVALTYALRNLQAGDDLRVLLTVRGDGETRAIDLAGSVLGASTEQIRLGPLSVGALHRLIRARLGASLSRPKLMRVHFTSGGNPLYAVELARVIADADPAEAALALPESLGAALRARLDVLSAETRAVLLAVAAAGEPRRHLLGASGRPEDVAAALDEAARNDVVVLDGEYVRFTHPLLASTVYTGASVLERRTIHVQLADLAETAEERARHLALAGSGPEEAVAAALERAAESACLRGARGTGAELYEQAARLTPPEAAGRRDSRVVAAADAHFLAGETEHARALLEEVSAGAGPQRFEALWRLGTLLDETVGGDTSLAAFEGALATEEPALSSRAHRSLAQTLVYVGDAERALEHADAAVARGDAVGDASLRAYALAMQALVRKIAAHPGWRDSLARALELEAEAELVELDVSPSAIEADTRRLVYQLDEARAAYERMLDRAAELGDVRTESWCRHGLAAVEIQAGRWPDAIAHSEELANLADQTSMMRLPALRASAHLALLQGETERARAILDEMVAAAEPMGELLNLRAALQLKGLLELSLGNPRAALEPLERARLIAEQMVVGEPSMLAFQLDEVEALAATHAVGPAGTVLARFEARIGQESAWTQPLLLRGRGLVHAAAGELDEARAALEAAVAVEHLLPVPLEHARTRLALGRVLRRLQQRRAAHEALSDALERFETLGAPLWAERAREELRRIGGRAPSRDELTPTERRIAELVAEGRTNPEVAELLFVTPKTVESTLTRIYRKLGVRSRTELARQLTLVE